jgi:hypothetical protein
MLQQRLGQQVQLVDVLGQQVARAGIGGVDDVLHLGVDLARGRL